MAGRTQVVLVPAPFQGHLTPMMELGSVLQSRGFSIVVAHAKLNSPNPCNHPDFIFLPVSNGLSDSETTDTTRNLFALVLDINLNCKEPLQDSVAQVMAQRGPQDEVACIIHDSLMYCVVDVANHLKLPNIVFPTSSAISFLTYSNFTRLQRQGIIPLKDSNKLLDLVPDPDLHPLRFKDLPVSKFGPLGDLLQLIEIQCRTKSSAIIWKTMYNLEHQPLAKLRQHFQVPIFSVGPLHKFAAASSSSLLEEDGSSILWLDKQAPGSVLYVSLGSLASVDENALAEMAWGLANSHRPFLWVIRPGSISGSQWTELLPENFDEVVEGRGYVVKWAPQKQVLAHKAVGGFWSHGGWNSTLESLSEGVPMICWPCFGDHNVIARYLSHVWGVGIELEQEMERGKIERAVRALMVDEEGKVMRTRAMDIKEKVEISVNEGGSSHKSLDELIKFISLL
ncbi:hypothetical protein NMG60_11034135 [Bertholletia excelsa]